MKTWPMELQPRRVERGFKPRPCASVHTSTACRTFYIRFASSLSSVVATGRL